MAAASTVTRSCVRSSPGIPPREDVIAAANAWLDEAERLTRLR